MQKKRVSTKAPTHKHSIIVDILGLFEEKGKTKDWLLEQIKKKNVKLKVSPTVSTSEILKNCPKSFVAWIHNSLLEEDFSINEISGETKYFHWFFTDIVGSSNPGMNIKAQARKINVLSKKIKETNTFKKIKPESVAINWTGDGMAIGFPDNPEQPLKLAIELHKELSKYNKTKSKQEKIFLRIGINAGPAYLIEDLEGKEAYWGDGIVKAKRVMDLCETNQIFASGSIADDIQQLSPQYKEIFHDIGEYTSKHNKKLLIYNVYGKGFGNKHATKKGKVVKKKQSLEQKLHSKRAFIFNSIQIKLVVRDLKSMLTHHEWIWNVVNMSDVPHEEIFYYIDGDVPKEFKEMKVKVTDEAGNKLDIIPTKLEPMHKELTVKMKKPLKPRQRNRFLKLEYDWEETDRNFFYRLPADCKKFQYSFTIPKGMDVKSRILGVNTELGEKWLADPSPKIRYLPKTTKIEWEKKNLNASDAFKFEW